MRKGKKESFFWTSYSDLMTSMFFVMLVLFVLTISMLHSRMVATERQLEQIRRIEKSIEKINPDYFQYDNKFKRHTLKNFTASFELGSSDINDISPSDQQQLLKAGQAIVDFMREAQDSIPDAQYLLIVEGQSSYDAYSRNYELSYERALSLVRFWIANDIRFDNLPCEVVISGSGISSQFRIWPEKINDKGNPANQRFVIHIIPKPGNFDEK